jgi:hypothetical protein
MIQPSERYQALALIGQHTGEEVLWLAATMEYIRFFPYDKIHFHRMTNSDASGLARNLGYSGSSDPLINTNIIKEIRETIKGIKPRIVLDLHTVKQRKFYDSGVVVLPSVVEERDHKIKEFPFYSHPHRSLVAEEAASRLGERPSEAVFQTIVTDLNN